MEKCQKKIKGVENVIILEKCGVKYKLKLVLKNIIKKIQKKV